VTLTRRGGRGGVRRAVRVTCVHGLAVVCTRSCGDTILAPGTVHTKRALCAIRHTLNAPETNGRLLRVLWQCQFRRMCMLPCFREFVCLRDAL